ncbi:metallophosphoesterase family protein [Breznakiella homolactica]|uniref:Metallophosphoesterase family protein n=1 Tax=Breznakiella homolactica TaxID=2798577 RepID=A0A7T8BAD5_9SPIR|nr:metallophosphoesterase family protein [Breznakiella homolactica]QQO10549.1 metallophosphatase family protein [Breznakiella homolactica]
MKVLVISDIHANIQSLEAIHKQEPSWDLLLCAGDAVDYGTHPKEAVQWLRDKKAIQVKGNHDAHTVAVYREGNFSAVPPGQYKWVHYACGQLDAEAIGYLDSLPLHISMEIDGIPYLLQHQYDEGYGTIQSLDQYDRFWDTHSTIAAGGAAQQRMIFGHSHRRCVFYLADEKLWLNPGSTSYRRPDDPDKTAHYAVIQDGTIHLRKTAYNRKPALLIARDFRRRDAMMETELQDAFFFFGDAETTRDPLPAV